jgi:hypothetical protein
VYESPSIPRHRQTSLTAVLLLLCAFGVRAADTYNGTELTIPAVIIGNATYSSMVVTVGGIVSGPTGAVPEGSADLFDPMSNQLTVPAVITGSGTDYNFVVRVGELISVNGVSGADIYDGTHLIIPNVQVLGRAAYRNVVVTVAAVDRVEGGMPALAQDEYIPETNELIIPAVQAYGRIFTNVIVKVGNVVSLGSGGPSRYAMGNGVGSEFVDQVIGIGNSGTLAAGGSVGLAVTIVDQNNSDTLDNSGPVTVTFNSPCLASGQAQILPAGSSTPSSSVTTTTGSINATYIALGCSGIDTITAVTAIGSLSLSAVGSVEIAKGAIGSIQFVSILPTMIGLKGTGLNETSTATFRVRDSTGAPESGVPVLFTLDTTVGGLSLSPASAMSATDGTVQTVVSAGTVHTVVRVVAAIANPALSTQSNSLTVTSGLPASGAFSVALGVPGGAYSGSLACPNVEAFDIDGVEVPVTVRLSDRYDNPVPDGTSIAFTTDGGGVQGTCTTPSGASPGDGACTVLWTSANPRPGQNPSTGAIDLLYGFPPGYSPSLVRAGRAMILATTIGEESFTDLNGSGYYQPGDPFANLGEPFQDDNEDGAYEIGETYLDFNHNGVRDAGTGSFVGVTCTGTSAVDTCTTSALAISASHLVVMSTSHAAPATLVNQIGVGGTSATGLTIPNGSSGTLTFNVQDQHGNAMAAGSVVMFSISNPQVGVALSTIPPTAFACDANVGGENFSVGIQSTVGITGSGLVTVTVISPSGAQTSTAYGLAIL